MMARVLLVQPNQRHEKYLAIKSAGHIPLSLLYLGTAIEKKHEVKIFDRNHYPEDSVFLELLKNYSPDIIGFNSMTGPMLLDIAYLGPIIKKYCKKTLIVVGGVHATVDPDSLLKERYVDYIIRGEADTAFLEFCDTYDKNPKKLGKLENVNKNPQRPLVDLNKLNPLNWGLINLKDYNQIWISTSRGCPGNCTFCYNARMWGRNGLPCVRFLNSENTIKLFKDLIENQNINEFTIADDNFVTFKPRCIEVCNFLANKYKGKISFTIVARADKVDDDILSALKRAGCNTILFGSESGSQRILNFLNKQMSVEAQGRGIVLARKHGIFNYDGFMIGIPGETIDDLNLTKRFIKKYKPDVVVGFAFNPMPGTAIFDNLIKQGLLKKPTTLAEWVKYNSTTWSSPEHNFSKIPDEVIIQTLKEFWRFRFKRTKLKKLWWWIRKGKIKYVIGKVIDHIRQGRLSSNF